VPPGMHVPLKPGDQLRFGESTRIYLFQTEQVQDQEEEERLLVQAMIEKQQHKRSEISLTGQGGDETEASVEEDDVIVWRHRGMQEDGYDEERQDMDDDDDDMMVDSGIRRTVDPDAYYHKDPKKALRHYLESKGYAYEFEMEESGPGHEREYTARIRLPIETSMGALYGIGITGKKKDAEYAAALDACIQLDSRGMLRQKNSSSGGGGADVGGSSSSRGKKYEDSDEEDDFYDRSGTQKKNRAVNAGSNKTGGTQKKAETHESLIERQKHLQSEIQELKVRIEEYDELEAKRKALEESNDLDAYMASLDKQSGKESKAKLGQMLAALKKETKKVEQLIEFTRPVDFFAKIGGGDAGGGGGSSSRNSSGGAVKGKEEDVDRVTKKRESEAVNEAKEKEHGKEVKKPRILGPARPPGLK
ncbi:Kanadaptin, partial [Podila humilis]